MMEVNEQIKRWQEFMELIYESELFELVREGKESIQIDFGRLSRYDPDLADHLLDNPDDCIKAGELAIQQFDLPRKIKNFKLRLKNLSNSAFVNIRSIRSKHIKKIVCVEGVVKSKADVRPQTSSARFECPSCGNIINILQLDEKFREPSRCSCGRKAKFTLISKELVDVQPLSLEEDYARVDNQPKKFNILLKHDLCSDFADKRTDPGQKIKVIGVVEEVPISAKDGGKLTKFDLMIDANNIEYLQDNPHDVVVTKDEESEVLKVASRSDFFDYLAENLAPEIKGREYEKKAVCLHLVGGVKKKNKYMTNIRGDIHLLLVGDPSEGKSVILKNAHKRAIKGRFVSGKGASGAGLTASVVKDEFIGGWTLEGGALPLSNNGNCFIDELDKMSSEDRSAMHEALEGQTIPIAKANIHATLKSECAVLAGANPKYGRFNLEDPLVKQINLPRPLFSRFDLVVPIFDTPDIESDEEVARFLLNKSSNVEDKEDTVFNHDTPRFWKVMLSLAKKIDPVMSKEAEDFLALAFAKLRNPNVVFDSKSGKFTKTNDERSNIVPITKRQVEGLRRISEAKARFRLLHKFRDKNAVFEINKEDAVFALDLMMYCLKKLAQDEEGNIDIDKLTSGVTQSQRNRIHIINQLVGDLSEGKEPVPIELIVENAKSKKISEEQVSEILTQLKRNGDIYEPRKGFVLRI